MSFNEKDIIRERINKSHDCGSFQCGNPGLDSYLQKYARQNDISGVGRTYIARFKNSRKVIGYYTIASSSIEGSSLPEKLSKILPRYPVPCALLGRLAVSEDHQGMGLGEFLLMDALFRILTISEQIGLFAIVVEAVDIKARDFYKKYGFEPFRDDKRRLVLSIKAVKKAFDL